MASTNPIPRPAFISTAPALRDLAKRLLDEPLVAVDTESNSLFAYQEQVCLIQLSTRQADYVVDPLAIEDMSPLGPLFSDPRIEKVFHAAEYDLMCMKRDYEFTFTNLFDTMVSGRILGYKTFGLANMLEGFFQVNVDKRYQRADWSLRPIPADQLQYAQQDTHFLPALRDILRAELEEKGYWPEAHEVFDRLADVPSASHNNFDPDGFWRINAARDFSRRQMAILRELYLLRDDLARERNRPAFKVVGDDVLANVAKAEPQTVIDLGAVAGMSRGQIDRYGHALVQAVLAGQKAKPPVRPDRAPRLDNATLIRFDALKEWRKTRAAERGVESDVIIPKEALWALATTPPQTLQELDTIPGLGPYKREKYGEELLRVLAQAQSNSGD